MQAPQTSGNYIHNLQMAVRTQAGALNGAYEAYMDLVGYLNSSKFHQDTTVQVADVLRRLQPIASAILEASWSPSESVRALTKPVIATGEITSL